MTNNHCLPDPTIISDISHSHFLPGSFPNRCALRSLAYPGHRHHVGSRAYEELLGAEGWQDCWRESAAAEHGPVQRRAACDGTAAGGATVDGVELGRCQSGSGHGWVLKTGAVSGSIGNGGSPYSLRQAQTSTATILLQHIQNLLHQPLLVPEHLALGDHGSKFQSLAARFPIDSVVFVSTTMS
jgi:hypothetical protein